jgi:hypothetical protein
MFLSGWMEKAEGELARCLQKGPWQVAHCGSKDPAQSET